MESKQAVETNGTAAKKATADPSKEKKVQIITEGKTRDEIIEQEIAAITAQWDSDLLMVERQPLFQVRIYMNYNKQKMLDMTIIFPQPDPDAPQFDYPNSSVIIKLFSKTLPAKLVETLQKKSEAMIKKLAYGAPQAAQSAEAKAPVNGKPQALVAFEFIKNILENNNLIPAWDEIPQIKEVLRLKPTGKEAPKEDKKVATYDEFKMFEKAGKFKIKLCEGKFFFEFELTVPEMYPQDCAGFKVIDHNFDQNYYEKFVHRAQQLIQRLHQGGEPGYIKGSKKDKLLAPSTKKNQGVHEYEMQKLKILSKEEMRRDVDFLNQTQELREMAAGGDKRSKKFMKLHMKHEKNYEENMQKEEEDMYIQKQIEQGLDVNMNKYAKPSLYHAVNFLANHFVRFLPTANCLVCGQKLVTPMKKNDNFQTSDMRPEVSYCGCWMHFKCFEEYVNSPPFLRECLTPLCGEKKFGSPSFKVDEASVKTREKAYLQEQQKRGEEDDLDKLLGF